MRPSAFKSMLGGAALALAAVGLQVALAHAAVSDQSPSGFELQQTAHIAASPDKVYAALIQPARWWSSAHSFSGDAANMSLDARAGGCWCEKLADGGSVLHMIVVFVDPGKVLRLRGALGPFQKTGMEGALTFALKPDGTGTDLTLTFDLGGYVKGGLADLPKAADAVMGEQILRLKQFIETGAPESRTSD